MKTIKLANWCLTVVGVLAGTSILIGSLTASGTNAIQEAAGAAVAVAFAAIPYIFSRAIQEIADDEHGVPTVAGVLEVLCLATLLLGVISATRLRKEATGLVEQALPTPSTNSSTFEERQASASSSTFEERQAVLDSLFPGQRNTLLDMRLVEQEYVIYHLAPLPPERRRYLFNKIVNDAIASARSSQ